VGVISRPVPDISADADDVTSAGHLGTNNGLFPAVPGFDLATGIGTIKMSPLITGFF
jgi:hypothetical protein